MLEDEFGDIIRKARTGQGLELKEVAQRAKLSSDDLNAFEDLKKLPDAAGIRSLARILKLDAEKLEAIALQRFAPQPRHERPATFNVQAMVVEGLAGWSSNCYLLNFPGSPETLIVDPGAQPERILAALGAHGWKPCCIALTHGHHDHVGALDALLRRYPVPVLLGSGDLELIGRLKSPVHVLEDDQRVEVGGRSVRALLIPGHTMGGVCYAFDGGCFVGDTLFAGSVGRPNVSGYYERYLTAIEAKVLSLSDDTMLFPGHGPMTTVGEERRANPFFSLPSRGFLIE